MPDLFLHAENRAKTVCGQMEDLHIYMLVAVGNHYGGSGFIIMVSIFLGFCCSTSEPVKYVFCV